MSSAPGDARAQSCREVVEIDTRILDDGVTIRLWGEALPGEWARLHDTICDLLKQGQRQFVVDVRLVQYLDSDGLGRIVSAYTTVNRQGGNLKVRGLSERFKSRWWSGS